MTDETIVLLILAILGTGGIGVIYRVNKEAPKYTAEAQSIVITNLQSEVKRLSEENVTLRAMDESKNIRIGILEGEMRILQRQVNGGG